MNLSWLNPRNWFSKSKSKGLGEQAIMSLFPGWGVSSYFTSWSANRTELVQHFRGWNYVAIRAICEELASVHPQLAYRRNPESLTGKRILSKSLRTKSITHLQEHEDLEPVDSDHPLLRLCNKPNIMDTWFTFRYKLQMYMELTGNSYIWVVPNRMKMPAELWSIPAQWVYPRAGDGKLIDHYDVRPSSGYIASEQGIGWFPGGGGRMELPADQVIQVQYPNPINFFDGYSPLTATAPWTDGSEAVDASRIAQFQNGAFPGVVLEIDKEVLDPSPEMIFRIKADFAAKYAGVRRTGEPVVLGPGIRLVPFTKTPVEMDYTGGGDQLKTWILAAHRIGPSVVGLAENTTFASMIASNAAYNTSTIRPKHVLWGQVLSMQLAARYDPDLVFYWPDNIPRDPDMQLKQHETYLRTGVMSINEVRQDIGLEPYPHGGDDPTLPMGVSPIGYATGDAPEDLPMTASDLQRWGGEKPVSENESTDSENETPGGDQSKQQDDLARKYLATGKGIRDSVRRYFDDKGKFKSIPLNGMAKR